MTMNSVRSVSCVIRFLGYEFSEYGLDVLGYTELDPRERPDPMAVVFPKVQNVYLFTLKS